MATGKRKDYDDDELVEDIAAHTLTQADIAEKHDLSEVFIGQISRGERREDLQKRIAAVSRGLIEQAKRRGASLADKAMGVLGKLADSAGKDDDVRRKAAVDILKFAMGDPAKPETNITQQQGLPGLTPEDYENLAKMKGGPRE